MSSYDDTNVLKNKLDWAKAFNRSFSLPLDRSSMFASKADADKYALGDGSDSRALGKTSYIGQILTVYENDAVAVYVINADRTLTMLATGGSTEELEQKINAEISSRISADEYLSGQISTIQETTIPALSAALSTSLSVTVEALDEAEEGYLSSYVVKQGGTQVGAKINIPKDKVFESAYMVNVSAEPAGASKDTVSAFVVTYDTTIVHVLSDDTAVEPGATVAEGTFSSIKNAYFGKEGGEGPYLRITVSHQDCPLYIAMPKLVDTYTGGETSTISVGVSNRTITAIVKNSAISADQIFDGAVIESKIGEGAVTETKIGDDAVTNAKIAANAVAEEQLSAASVTTTKIANGAVTSDKLADNSVTTGKIADGAVETADIADAAVTHAKIAANAVESSNILSGAVVEDKIADNAVTEAKINDAAVTSGKIATNAVTESKLSADSVSTVKIQDGAVTEAKLASNTVTTEKIVDGNITKAKLSGDVTDWVESVAQSGAEAAFLSAKTYTDEEIQKLDVNDITGFGKGKTLSTLTETDGKISATFVDIEVTESQVTNLTTDLDAIRDNLSGDADGSVNARISAAKAAAKDELISADGVLSTDSTIFGAKAYTDAKIEKLSADTSAYLDAKVQIGTYVSGIGYDLSASNLSVVRIDNDEYYKMVSLSTIDPNVVYILSSDKLNAHGDTIINVAAPELSSDAATKGYVDDISAAVDAKLTGYVQLSSVKDSDQLTESNKIVTQKDIAALTGVMHFKGVATNNELSTGSTVIPVPPYSATTQLTDLVQGDFVIDKVGSEFVWAISSTGATACWYKVGDETIYATKAALDQEIADRAAADTQILTTVSDVSAQIETDIATEASARAAADNYISSQVSAAIANYLSAVVFNGITADLLNHTATFNISCIDCGDADPTPAV